MSIGIVGSNDSQMQALLQSLKQERFTTALVSTPQTFNSSLASGHSLLIMLQNSATSTEELVSIIDISRASNLQAPIIILSDSVSSTDAIALLNAGADDYIASDTHTREIGARIRALLRRPTVQATPKLTVEDLTLNIDSFTASRQGKEINLTSKEFRVLELLMKNKGTPVNKHAIAQDVWNEELEILPNTVEVYIRYLRRKIDDPFKKPLIRTVHGIGYRIG
jgi:DNA-binding response OmpR family regulator